MRETLDPALKLLFGSEGGYWNDPAGGPTKYGITQRTLTAHRGKAATATDVQNLTLDEAAAIYRAGYWSQSGGDVLPAGVDYAVFDFGVNSGPATAVKHLQRVVGVKADGNCGPMTVDAVGRYAGGATKLIADLGAARMAYLRTLKNWGPNARGWKNRVDQVTVDAIAMARGSAPTPGVTKPIPTPKAPPAAVNPWTQPDVVISAVTAVGGASSLLTGTGPVQIAIAAVIVIGALTVALSVFRKTRADG